MSDKIIDVGIKLHLDNWPIKVLCGLRVKGLADIIKAPGPDGIDEEKDEKARGFIGLRTTSRRWSTRDMTVEHAQGRIRWPVNCEPTAPAPAAAGPGQANHQVRRPRPVHGHGAVKEHHTWFRSRDSRCSVDADYIVVLDINTATADLSLATVHNQLLNVEVRVSKQMDDTKYARYSPGPRHHHAAALAPVTPRTAAVRLTSRFTCPCGPRVQRGVCVGWGVGGGRDSG